MDRVAAGRLRQGELVVPASEGVPPVADPVGPGHQQLTTPARALSLRKVSGEHVTTASGVGADAAPDLDDDHFVVVEADGPLLTAGECLVWGQQDPAR